MADIGKIGDRVGYRVMQLHARHWVETDCPTVGTVRQAVGMVRDYQQGEPQATFAIARLQLVMISRPDTKESE